MKSKVKRHIPRTITIEHLENGNACYEAKEIFKSLFPKGAEVTRANFIRFINNSTRVAVMEFLEGAFHIRDLLAPYWEFIRKPYKSQNERNKWVWQQIKKHLKPARPKRRSKGYAKPTPKLRAGANGKGARPTAKRSQPRRPGKPARPQRRTTGTLRRSVR
jgi:hypothetical protein